MAMEQDYWGQFEPVPVSPMQQAPFEFYPQSPTYDYRLHKGFAPGENPPGTRPGPIIPGQDTQGPPVTGPTPAAGGNSRSAFGQQWLASGGRTVTDLQRFVEQWNAANPNARVTLGGSKGDKVYGPQGEYWADAVISAGIGGGQGAAWNEDTGGGAGTPGAMGSMDGFGAYTAPFTERYELPSLSDLQHMPGYQAGLDEYRKGIETSAASKGTLLTGGTLQRLGRAGTDYANQAYGQLAGLKANEFGINRDIFYRNQDSPFSKYYSLAELGRPR